MPNLLKSCQFLGLSFNTRGCLSTRAAAQTAKKIDIQQKQRVKFRKRTPSLAKSFDCEMMRKQAHINDYYLV